MKKHTGILGKTLLTPFNLVFLFCFFLANTEVFAKVDAVKANALANELTPFGAIKAGNGEAIPAWTGQAKSTVDEQALFVITAENYQQHKKHLSAGQTAMFERYPDSFNMPIYPSIRTFSAPDWVYKNTKKNALNTTLNKDGAGISHALGGIAFPIPQSALEIYFNHISRWRGKQMQSHASDANVFESGKFSITSRESLIRYDHYLEDHSDTNRLFSAISKTTAPANKSGGGGLVLEPIDQLNHSRSAWFWDNGRRRVIRAPHVAYDQPVESAQSLRTADDTDMINGSPDRFNWQMLEKREIYIPYNNELLSSKKLKYKNLLHKFHLNPEHTRYELHRVWVIRATLKDQWRHVYSRRDFYLDEDSWQIVLADQYDKHDQLWRVSMAYVKQYQQMPGIFPVVVVFHDLLSRRYHVVGLQNETSKENVFNGQIAKDNLFTPSGLKRFVR